MSVRRSQRGSQLVEFALILPAFLLLVFGIIEFGRMLQVYHTITDAAREGARYSVAPCAYDHAVAGVCDAGQTPSQDKVRAVIQRYLDAGAVKGAVVTVDQASTASFNGTNTTYTVVQITAPYKFVYSPIGGTVNLTTQVKMRNENSE